MISLLEKNRWLAVLFTILITIEIFYFSTIQGSIETGGIIPFAKIYHFIAFFLFAFFLFMSIKGTKKIKISYIIITLTVSILYAISDEIHQIFVPLRNASIGDVFINTLGICFAMVIGLIINKKTTSQT